jgi:hypothetical protein
MAKNLLLEDEYFLTPKVSCCAYGEQNILDES